METAVSRDEFVYTTKGTVDVFKPLEAVTGIRTYNSSLGMTKVGGGVHVKYT